MGRKYCLPRTQVVMECAGLIRFFVVLSDERTGHDCVSGSAFLRSCRFRGVPRGSFPHTHASLRSASRNSYFILHLLRHSYIAREIAAAPRGAFWHSKSHRSRDGRMMEPGDARAHPEGRFRILESSCPAPPHNPTGRRLNHPLKLNPGGALFEPQTRPHCASSIFSPRH